MLKTLCSSGSHAARTLRRSFFTAPLQKFSADKVLPHSKPELFRIISDIDSYSSFVPFCTGSKVTARTVVNGTEVPEKATLQVGYKSYKEEFSSIVNCTPDSIVQATALNHPIFEKLITAWHLTPSETPSGKTPGAEKTTVRLDIEYKFSNPLYGALSAAVLPKVADQIIAAFQTHAQQVLSRKGKTAST